MKYFFSFILILLFINCKKEQTNKVSEDVNTPTIKTQKKIITFDARLTLEEWVSSVWQEQFGESPDKILSLIELNTREDAFDLFFVAADLEETYYYSLISDENHHYKLSKIETSDNSWLKSYGKSSFVSSEVYDISLSDINKDNTKEIIVSTEINGMTQANDGDGMMPFKKVQLDILSVNKDGSISHNKELTSSYNTKRGIVINEDSHLTPAQFIHQKHFSCFKNNPKQEDLENLLTDLDFLTPKKTELKNEFEPVVLNETNKFVIDRGLLFYQSYFIPYYNDFNLEKVEANNYPIFYIEDHGVYTYKISHISLIDNKINLSLEQIYHQDEHNNEFNFETKTQVNMAIDNINNKWAIFFKSNILLPKKDRLDLEYINSNEGQ